MAILTVLSPINTRQINNLTLLKQVAAYNKRRLAVRQLSITDNSQSQINSVSREAKKTRTLQSDLDGSIDLLGDAIRRIATIRGFTATLLGNVVTAAGAAASTEFTTNARAFDSYVSRLDGTAESARFSPNLLSATQQRAFTFDTNETGASETVGSNYVGTDYTITDTAGNIWVREGSFTKVLRRTDPITGAATGESASLVGGIRLDSFNAATQEAVFTISPDTAGATQFTGTVNRTGLGILDSWLYGGLETLDGRTRAETDIEIAKRTLDGESSRYNRYKTTAEFYRGRTVGTLKGFNTRISDITLAQAIKLQEVQSEFVSLASLTASTINGAQSVRNQYLNLLGGGTSRFARALINALA